MFDSKTKKEKKEIEVNIETMADNIKGSQGEMKKVEYETENSTKNNIKEKVKKETINENKIRTTQKPSENQFNDVGLPVFKPAEQKKFTENIVHKQKEIKDKNIENKGIEELEKNYKKDDFVLQNKDKQLNVVKAGLLKEKTPPFLQQALVDQNKKTKKTGISSFILILLFILLLAGILFGGYYFYMHKMNKNTNNLPKIIDRTANKTLNNKKNSEKKEKIATTPIKNKNLTGEEEKMVETTSEKDNIIEKATAEELIIEETSFDKDLKVFIDNLKKRKTKEELQKGVFVNLVLKDGTPFSVNSLLKVLSLEEFFTKDELKNKCKLFVIEDSGKERLAVIFEFNKNTDTKNIKNKVTRKEKELLKKLLVLFVDREKPKVPEKTIFVTNPENKDARYDNYVNGVNTTSVDWNILNLNTGDIIYFATSKKTAVELTKYFLKLEDK